MRSSWFVLCAVLGAGCQVAYRSSAGGATAPSGYSTGVSRSLRFSDEGGLLSRAGLGAFSVAAAAGAVENVHTNSTVYHAGDKVIVETQTSATINTKTAAEAQAMANAAGDPNTKLSSASGGLAANLEIAGTTLGGDTHGWQYDMGYAWRVLKGTKDSSYRWGFRGYVGAGYGSFTMYGRMKDRVDRGPPMYGDAETKFIGIPSRAGIWIVSMNDGIKSLKGTETFVKLNLNASGPTTFHLGQRFQYSLVYFELEVATSGASSDDRSLGLEFGVGI